MSAERTALYRAYAPADRLLYIGVAKDFGVRWHRHASAKPWWSETRRLTVDWYDTRDEALDAEALAIFTEQPEHNVMHRHQAVRLKKARATVTRQIRHPAEDSPSYLEWLESPAYFEFIRNEVAGGREFLLGIGLL